MGERGQGDCPSPPGDNSVKPGVILGCHSGGASATVMERMEVRDAAGCGKTHIVRTTKNCLAPKGSSTKSGKPPSLSTL